MPKDTQEALERLEAQLLAQETVKLRLDEEPDQDEMDEDELDALLEDFLQEDDPPAPRYQNYSNGYGQTQVFRAYNSDELDTDLDEYSDEVYEEPPKERLGGLLITAGLLLLGIVGVLVYWAVHFL